MQKAYIHTEQYDLSDITEALEYADYWYKLVLKFPKHLKTQEEWNYAEQHLDFIVDQYLEQKQSARKGIIYIKQEIPNVTKAPLWWLPAGGESKVKRGKNLRKNKLWRLLYSAS